MIYHILSIWHTVCFLLWHIACFLNSFWFLFFFGISFHKILKQCFNHKSFPLPIWSITFSKTVFIFWYSYMISNFKLGIFFINLFTKSDIGIIFYINRLLIVLWYVLLYSFTISANLSIYTFFIIEVIWL